LTSGLFSRRQLDILCYTLLRLVLDLESRAHISKEQIELLNWLPVNSRVDHLTLCHVFKMKNGLSA